MSASDPSPPPDPHDGSPSDAAPPEPSGEPAAVTGLSRAERRHRQRRSPLRSLLEWVAVIGGALIVALVIRTFLFQAFYIPSESMLPTLQESDRVLVNKLSYDLHGVNRGDIVVFGRPPNEPPSEIPDLIKRVIATGGETVEGRDGRIWIDGRPLEEPYLSDGVTTATFDPVEVPEDHVFVMGDNRGNSRDSRVFGPVPEDIIVGRAFVRVWPVSRLGLL
ncbi:MAG TPA: signal peptidase I [Acidimicrobiales bacterium]|nr:signal peptidase I [Acidimicrobiales bacterium]